MKLIIFKWFFSPKSNLCMNKFFLEIKKDFTYFKKSLHVLPLFSNWRFRLKFIILVLFVPYLIIF